MSPVPGMWKPVFQPVVFGWMETTFSIGFSRCHYPSRDPGTDQLRPFTRVLITRRDPYYLPSRTRDIITLTMYACVLLFPTCLRGSPPVSDHGLICWFGPGSLVPVRTSSGPLSGLFHSRVYFASRTLRAVLSSDIGRSALFYLPGPVSSFQRSPGRLPGR